MTICAVCCSVLLQCVAVCWLQCVAVCCSVLQCVAVCCSSASITQLLRNNVHSGTFVKIRIAMLNNCRSPGVTNLLMTERAGQ